jgi:hypothetical protein
MRNALLAIAVVAIAACAKSKGSLTLDELDTDIPHRPLEATCAAFQPPGADGAYVFAADIVDEKTHAAEGTLHVAVEPGAFHDAPAWFVDEKWDDAGDRGRGPHQTKHARTWLAPDLRLLSAVVDVDTTRLDGSVERLHSELGPTEHGYWIAVTKPDGSSAREESTSAGPSWAATFAGAMTFVRRCPADSAQYAGKRGDFLVVRTKEDGTMTVSGFASMSVTVRASDRAPLSLTEHVWELSPRRFEVRGAPR